MHDALVIAAGFDRPEIELVVMPFHHEQAKRDALVADVTHTVGSGIVYCATRKAAEAVAAELGAHGVVTAVYPAGLARARRDEVHRAFQAGDRPGPRATKAVRMGIAKP